MRKMACVAGGLLVAMVVVAGSVSPASAQDGNPGSGASSSASGNGILSGNSLSLNIDAPITVCGVLDGILGLLGIGQSSCLQAPVGVQTPPPCGDECECIQCQPCECQVCETPCETTTTTRPVTTTTTRPTTTTVPTTVTTSPTTRPPTTEVRPPLPKTGSSTTGPATALGVGLVVAGAALFGAARRLRGGAASPHDG